MKAYVNHLDNEDPVVHPLAHSNPRHVVHFSSSPRDWTMGLPQALTYSAQLNAAAVHAKNHPDHKCHFEIEEVDEDVYVIVCENHPGLTESTA